MDYKFSGGLTAAREQFIRLVDELVTESRDHDEKWVHTQTHKLCDDFIAYSITQGPDADSEHVAYDFRPPQKAMNKLARLLAGD